MNFFLKPFLFLLSFIFFNSYLKCQDTLYYDKDFITVTKSEGYEYFGVVEYQDEEKERGMMKRYFKEGTLQAEQNFSSVAKGIREGQNIEWYKNGNKKSDANYIEGKLTGKNFEWYENGKLKSEIEYLEGNWNGILKTYWKNGHIKRSDTYQNQHLTKGSCYDSLGVEVKHFPYQVMPVFPGGTPALMKYLSRNVKYPKESIRNLQEGKVFVSFVIDQLGSVTNVRVMKGISPELDAEAVTAVKNMPKWNPGIMDGEPCSVRYQLPITFNLNMTPQEKERIRRKNEKR